MEKLIYALFALSLLPHQSMSPDVQADSVNKVQQSPVPEKVRNDTRPFSERITVGGSTGFWIQPRQTHFEIAGLIAYHFQKVLSVGPGYRYIYTRNRVYGKNLNS